MDFPTKLKHLRKAHNMTQAEFAKALGISRGNFSNIEVGKVSPTPLFINCVSLMFHIDRDWLTDDSQGDLSVLMESANMRYMILSKYDQLNENYKKFVEDQISRLLDLQKSEDLRNRGKTASRQNDEGGYH